jgi:aerobic-type carbon monoxide dehydrogenase small subunit (CoxS/CutS family)
MPLAAIDGMAVTTIEGLGNVRDGLDPVQVSEAILKKLRMILCDSQSHNF